MTIKGLNEVGEVIKGPKILIMGLTYKESVPDTRVDCIIVIVAHDKFKVMTLEKLKEMMDEKLVLIDVRGMFDGEEANRQGFYYRRL